MEIEDIIIHNEYRIKAEDQDTMNDIALLKLKSRVDLSKYTPACLPESNRTFDDRIAWVYGWGLYIDYQGPPSRKLRQIAVKVISDQECLQPQHWPGDDLQGTLCAVGFSYDVHICDGDSGGPLTVEEADGRHTLIGLVRSSPENCGGVKM